ncbi:hypothetical protein VSU19_08845 [Verrucomicrobiales bacterium BCK34]|nr:hypothetical protein [Verrucomicrobiales bacterium BCK34]
MKCGSIGFGIFMILFVAGCSNEVSIQTYDLGDSLEIEFIGERFWDVSSGIDFVVRDPKRILAKESSVSFYVPSDGPPPTFQFYWTEDRSVLGIAENREPAKLLSVIDTVDWVSYVPWGERPREPARALVEKLSKHHPDIEPFP